MFLTISFCKVQSLKPLNHSRRVHPIRVNACEGGNGKGYGACYNIGVFRGISGIAMWDPFLNSLPATSKIGRCRLRGCFLDKLLSALGLPRNHSGWAQELFWHVSIAAFMFPDKGPCLKY